MRTDAAVGAIGAAHRREQRGLFMVDEQWRTASSWATNAVTPADLSALHGLLPPPGGKVLLGVDLGHFEPARAADEARYAREILGTDLLGIEIGNEPNDYRDKKTTPSVNLHRQRISARSRSLSPGTDENCTRCGDIRAGFDPNASMAGHRWGLPRAYLPRSHSTTTRPAHVHVRHLLQLRRPHCRRIALTRGASARGRNPPNTCPCEDCHRSSNADWRD